MRDVELKRETVSVYVSEGERDDLHVIFYDITLGFWVFVFFKEMKSLSCQDNHVSCNSTISDVHLLQLYVCRIRVLKYV